MKSEFDMVFDTICSDIFPDLDIRFGGMNQYHVDLHDIIDYICDEGYDTDMAAAIIDAYMQYRIIQDARNARN